MKVTSSNIIKLPLHSLLLFFFLSFLFISYFVAFMHGCSSLLGQSYFLNRMIRANTQVELM